MKQTNSIAKKTEKCLTSGKRSTDQQFEQNNTVQLTECVEKNSL